MSNTTNKVKFLLNWNHFNEHISNCMARLMTDSTYSDVIIATGDKRMIYAHRFVLANSSKYFQRLLKQMNKQRGLQLVVALPEVKYEILKVLMNYMYRGETQVPHELLPSVIKIGRLLEINGLVDLHEADSTANGASIWTYNKGENQASRSVLRPTKTKEDKKETRAAVKPRCRDVANTGTETKKKTKCQNVDIDSTSEQAGTYKSGNVRRFRPILPKNEASAKNSKKEYIHLPLKRKYSKKDQDKESPSSSTENPGSGSRKTIIQQETHVVKIKREKLDEDTWEIDNQPAEEITIKTEAPFEIDDINDINFNELYCDFCKENYSTPSEWVRHMSDHHGEHGYESNKERENEEGTETVYNCVICSEAMYSAAEWIQHIRVWHTDAEHPSLSKGGKKGGKDRDPKETQTRRKYGP